MEIKIRNEFDLQDFAEAERITPARGHFFYRYNYVLMRGVLVLLVLISVFFIDQIFASITQIDSWSQAGRLAMGLLLAGGLLGGKIKAAWNSRYGDAFGRMQRYRYRIYDEILVTGAGIKLLSGISETLTELLPWSDLSGFHEGPRILLVVTTISHDELIIPKRNISEEEQGMLRALFTEEIGVW